VLGNCDVMVFPMVRIQPFDGRRRRTHRHRGSRDDSPTD
jgi:hypothetical protein